VDFTKDPSSSDKLKEPTSPQATPMREPGSHDISQASEQQAESLTTSSLPAPLKGDKIASVLIKPFIKSSSKSSRGSHKGDSHKKLDMPKKGELSRKFDILKKNDTPKKGDRKSWGGSGEVVSIARMSIKGVTGGGGRGHQDAIHLSSTGTVSVTASSSSSHRQPVAMESTGQLQQLGGVACRK